MGIASTPSAITLPPSDGRQLSILEFLIAAFPHVPAARWVERLGGGKLHDIDGRAITAATPYRAGMRILYYREVDDEPRIPFTEQILYRDTEILVADKPHFLPVVPGGPFVNECLQQRLRDRTGEPQLMPLHRIDRDTAGLVLFSVNPASRRDYHNLFAHRRIEKIYDARAHVPDGSPRGPWSVANRLVRGDPRFRMTVVDGPVNARSEIELLETAGRIGRFRLRPLTGKTHQLRVHMAALGFPIVNDRCYPQTIAVDDRDYSRPLQLLARSLAFIDPVRGVPMQFESTLRLEN